DEADDDEAAAPVLLLLLLQAAAVRARTLSPAAAITRFMVEIPPLLRGELPDGPPGPPVTAPGLSRVWGKGHCAVMQAPETHRASASPISVFCFLYYAQY
ncbi:MAG TPA: hypothetical protein VHV09_04260, partial [Trebonia sp.]|nr:hypothetical protein [Trebonia sp.]